MSDGSTAKNPANQAPTRRAQAFRAYLARIKRALITRPSIKLSDARGQSLSSPFPFAVSRDNVLDELGKKYMPSKRNHNYLIYYWLHFRDIRLHVRKVIEIGVQTDCSIRMWEEFFPNATIAGTFMADRTSGHEVKGASGIPTRTLVELVEQLAAR